MAEAFRAACMGDLDTVKSCLEGVDANGGLSPEREKRLRLYAPREVAGKSREPGVR